MNFTPLVRHGLPISDLVPFTFLRPWRWALDLALDWTIIIAFFVAFDALGRPWLLAPLFALGIGARQHALSLLGHDGTHRVALRNRFWNDRLTEWFAGWVLGATLDGGYRDWHFAHHRTLGTPEDPELAYRGAGSSYAPPVTRGRVWRRFGLDLLGLGASGLWVFLREILPTDRIRYTPPVVFYAAFFVVSWRLDALWVFGLWSFSIVSGFWAVFRMRTWLEHVGLESAGRHGSHRFSANVLERFLFFPHNTWCHYEHHLYPQVPYIHLPALRARLLAAEGDGGRRVMTFRETLARFHEYDGTLVARS